MSKWKIVRLGELLTHRKEFIEIDDLETYKRCRVQLHAKGIVLRDQISGAEIKTKQQQVCRVGEFLVAEIDAKLGGYGIVPNDLEGAIVSSHYFLFGINEDKLDRSFLGYFIQTPAFFEQVAAQGSTNYAAIRPGHILQYTIPLPSLAEQRRLVERIDALAAKIEEARYLRSENQTHLEALAGSMLAGMISRATTSKPLSHMILPGSTISYGVLVPGSDEPSGVPFVRIQDLHPSSPPVMPSKRIAPHIDARYARTRLRGNEVLVAVVGATIGKVGTVPPSWIGANIARAVCRIIPGPLITREFLIAALKSKKVQDYFRETTRTLAQPTLNVGQLEETPIPVVPLEQQHQILAELNTLESALHTCQELQKATMDELDAMLPAVLDRAFRGEL